MFVSDQGRSVDLLLRTSEIWIPFLPMHVEFGARVWEFSILNVNVPSYHKRTTMTYMRTCHITLCVYIYYMQYVRTWNSSYSSQTKGGSFLPVIVHSIATYACGNCEDLILPLPVDGVCPWSPDFKLVIASTLSPTRYKGSSLVAEDISTQNRGKASHNCPHAVSFDMAMSIQPTSLPPSD